MKNKNLVIFLNPHIWDLNIWDAMEVEKYKKDFNVVVYELGHFLNKLMVKSFINKVNNKSIVRPVNIKIWRNHIFNLVNRSKKKKILIISCVNPLNLNSYLLFRDLSKLNVNIVHFNNPGLPLVNIKKNFIEKINQVIDLRYLIFFLNKKIFSFLFRRLKFYNFFYLVSGLDYYQKLNYKKKILGISWDFNKEIENKNLNLKKKYAVYVQSTLNFGDAPILGPNFSQVNKNDWVYELNRFFDEFEKKTDLKVIIAAHPKTKKDVVKYFKSRKLFFNKTQELINKSSFVFLEHSTAISFVVKYKKPALMLYSTQTISKSYYRDNFFSLAKLAGIKTHNIVNKFSGQSKNKLFSVNGKQYKLFQKNYLGKSNITNFLILKKKFFC